MAFVTEALLRELARDERFDRNLRVMRSAAEKSIFLSHSHRDRALALGLQRLLAARGLILYLDWQDTEMPDSPNRETAERIKERIGLCDFFLLLATANAMGSRWVPWEVGVADSRKANDHIVIVPVEDAAGNCQGNEYLQLYRRLEMADKGLGVFEPNRTSGQLVEFYMRHR